MKKWTDFITLGVAILTMFGGFVVWQKNENMERAAVPLRVGFVEERLKEVQKIQESNNGTIRDLETKATVSISDRSQLHSDISQLHSDIASLKNDTERKLEKLEQKIDKIIDLLTKGNIPAR